MQGRKAYSRDREKSNFWSKITRCDNGCWEWVGERRKSNYLVYGRAQLGNKRHQAHRVSWMIHFGDIPKGMLVCHKCDNPICVNPDHLFLGTHWDNVQDSIRKGRFRHWRWNNAKDRNP